MLACGSSDALCARRQKHPPGVRRHRPGLSGAFDQTASRPYGPLRAELERRGQLIGPNDLMIAAHALALDLTLVTDHTGEFSRVAGLRVENWLRRTPAV